MPKQGASIAIFASGARILDQLGVYDALVAQSDPATYDECWKDGRRFDSTQGLKAIAERHGYPMRSLLRYHLLKALYDNISDRSRILASKHVTRIDHDASGVTVQCGDGSSYQGDIIVGADGVHSIVRQEMRGHANQAQDGTISVAQQSLLKAEYRCVWGVSNPVPTIRPGGVVKTFRKDTSFLMLTGKAGQVFWFLFDKLDQTYYVPYIPKYTKKDAEELVMQHFHTKLTDTISLSDLWDTRVFYALTPLEEALHNKWTWGRIACVRDSVHKMTPNIGQGGNNAIETAAALLNAIHGLLPRDKQEGPSISTTADITKALTTYQTRRMPRTKAVSTVANKVTRLEALAGPLETFVALHIMPRLSSFVVYKQSLGIAGAECIECLPEPDRAMRATWPFEHQGRRDNGKTTVARSNMGSMTVAILLLLLLPLLLWMDFAAVNSRLVMESCWSGVSSVSF